MSTPLHPCPTVPQHGRTGMPTGHRGRHTTVAFCCDVCSTYRRGSPAGIEYDTNGDPDLGICWFCLNVTAERARRLGPLA